MQYEKLHKLIHSLHQGEKRHFKLFINKYAKSSGSHLMQLFEAIHKQKKYAPKEFTKQYTGEPFMKNVAVNKVLLYDTLLQSLCSYKEHQSAELAVYDLLKKVKVLFNKALYDDCLQQLQKARKIATQQEYFDLLYRISIWESKIINLHHQKKEYPLLLHHIEERSQYIENLQNLNNYRKLYQELANLYYLKGLATNPSIQKTYDNIIAHPLLQDPEHARSFFAKKYYADTYILYYGATKQYDKEFEFQKKQLFFLEQHPNILKENLESYIIHLHDLIVAQIYTGNSTNYVALLEVFEAIPTQFSSEFSKDLNNLHLSHHLLIQASLHYHQKNYTGFLSLIDTYQSQIKGKEKRFDRFALLNLYHYFAFALFNLGQYDTALDWSNKIVDEAITNTQESFFAAHRLLGILCHFEMGNMQLVPHLVQAARRYFRKTIGLDPYVAAIFGFFYTKASKQFSKKQIQKELPQLRAKLADIQAQAPVRHFWTAEFERWLST